MQGLSGYFATVLLWVISTPQVGRGQPARTAVAEFFRTPTSLADARFATTKQRVLPLLQGQPDRSFITGA